MGVFSSLFKSRKFQLTVGDVILLYNFEKARNINSGYCRYFEYTYGITNPKERALLLYQEGYLMHAGLEESLKSYKLSQLKVLCKNRNLLFSGKKTTLIERLMSIPDIQQDVPNSLYSLTDLGKKTISDYCDYIKYHKNSFDIDLSTFSSLLSQYGNYNDAIFNHLTKNEITLARKDSWGLYRNNKLYFARYYRMLNDIDNEFLYYLETFYCDLSGYGNSYRDRLKDLMIAPGIVKHFCENPEYYSDEKIERCIKECKIPKSYFTNDQFNRVINYLLIHEEITIDELLKLKKS